jgi:hypothetical protein
MATRRDWREPLVKIRIYVEGGSKGKLATECRRGFRTFFERAGLIGRMPAVVACGSRNDAYDDFCTAVKRPQANTLPLLLVDSEDALSERPWEHLKTRDDWDRPDAVAEDQAYLMVQCMEAWFLADRDCLKEYFGQGFTEKQLPGNEDVETIPKTRVFKSLKMATRRSESKGEYVKGKHSFEILGLIDPKKVRNAAPDADRLLKRLEQTN